MNQFKSMIFFLAFLLLIQPALQGCTNIAYHVGRSSDIKRANEISQIDYSEINKGDWVEIHLISDTIIRGKVVSTRHKEMLKVESIRVVDKKSGYKKRRSVFKRDIVSIKKIDVGKKYTIGLTTIGVVIDTAITGLVVLSILVIVLLKPFIEGLEGF